MYICLCNDLSGVPTILILLQGFCFFSTPNPRTESQIMKVSILELHICKNRCTCKYCSPCFCRDCLHDAFFCIWHVTNNACLVDVFYHSGKSHVWYWDWRPCETVFTKGSRILVLRMCPGEEQHFLEKCKKKKLIMGSCRSDIKPIGSLWVFYELRK